MWTNRPPTFCIIAKIGPNGPGRSKRHQYQTAGPFGAMENIHALIKREYGPGKFMVAEVKNNGDLSRPYTVEIFGKGGFFAARGWVAGEPPNDAIDTASE